MQQPTSIPRLAVLVNTCDKFNDCWHPFFVLWRKFGLQALDHVIYLNTERKTFESPELSVRSLRVCTENGWADPKPPTWSWCLDKGLEAIREPFVLYLQEDYFLTRTIDEVAISKVLVQMESDPDIGCVHLTSIGIRRTIPAPDHQHLRRGDSRDWYYVSCQAAIWRKSVLSALVRPHENAWQFERWASKRARWMGFQFYVFDCPVDKMPIDYIQTGIIQGKWFKPVVPLFHDNGIDMDFSKRGFYEGKYGQNNGRWIAYQYARLRYVVRAILVRYILPIRSLLEVEKLKVRPHSKNGQ